MICRHLPPASFPSVLCGCGHAGPGPLGELVALEPVLLSLVYLFVWLATRSKYHHGGVLSTIVIAFFSLVELLFAGLLLVLVIQLARYSPP